MPDMTPEDYDLFDIADGVPKFPGEEGIERDRWDRPLILPDPAWRTVRGGPPVTAAGWRDGQVVKGQMADGRRPYRRISTISKGLDTAYGLGIWKLRHAVLSVARRPDLQALLCGMTYLDGKRIDAVIEEALIRAKDDGTDPEHKLTAAHRGTAFHTFTTPGAPDIDPTYGPTLANYRIAADKFRAALADANLEVISSERFVVNDRLEAAGTYDHLVRDLITGRVHVLDKKTGELRWSAHMCQEDGYAKGMHYDPKTGERSPLDPDGMFDGDTAFIAHTNLETGECEIYPIDLGGGYAALGSAVHRANSSEAIKERVGPLRGKSG